MNPILSSQRVRLVYRIITAVIFICCLLPLLSPVSIHSWKIRLISILVILPLITIVGCSYLLTVRTSVGARGVVPKDPQNFRKVFRVGISCTAVLFTLGVIIPVEWSGIKSLSYGTVEVFSGRVTDNHTVFGTWFIMQQLSVEGTSQTFNYFLCSEPIRVGNQYQFLVLNDFPLVLQIKQFDRK